MNRQLIRMQTDSTRVLPWVDVVTREQPIFYQKTDLRLDLWATSGNSPWDITNVTQFEVQFRDPTNPGAAPIVDQIVAASAFNFTYVTPAAFATGASNVSFFIAASATALFPVLYNSQRYLLFILALLSTGDQLVVQAGPVDVLWDGLTGSNVPQFPLGARIFNGIFQIYCPDNGLYYNVLIRLDSGIPTLSVEGAGNPP